MVDCQDSSPPVFPFLFRFCWSLREEESPAGTSVSVDTPYHSSRSPLLDPSTPVPLRRGSGRRRLGTRGPDPTVLLLTARRSEYEGLLFTGIWTSCWGKTEVSSVPYPLVLRALLRTVSALEGCLVFWGRTPGVVHLVCSVKYLICYLTLE